MASHHVGQRLFAFVVLGAAYVTSCADILGIEGAKPKNVDVADAGASGMGSPSVAGDGTEPDNSAGKIVSASAGASGSDIGGGGGDGGEGGGGAGSPEAGGAGAPEKPCDPLSDTCDFTDGYQLHACRNGILTNESCDNYCHAGSCASRPPSCIYDPLCTTTNADCCETIWIPGGTFKMAQTYSDRMTFDRTLSGYFLDRFEVTVERFRVFAQSYAVPKAGAGANSKIHSSGWDTSWESLLVDPSDPSSGLAVPKTPHELEAQITACGGNDYGFLDGTVPINCVNWYVAFAFCAWDGGRLPTDAEWNFASAHGADERNFAWSDAPPSSTDVSCDNAWFLDCNVDKPQPVGQRRLGRGGFNRPPHPGHDDLGGNVAEWTADRYDAAPAAQCTNCMAGWGTDGPDHLRVMHGGSFGTSFVEMRSGDRQPLPASISDQTLGFRCARDLSGGE